MKYFFLFLLLICLPGCGYTTGSLLEPHIKKIYVENFANAIDITDEAEANNIYKTYRPRLEMDVTKAIIDKFIFDGNLKISRPEGADVILSGELVNFEKEALRYDEADNVEQHRIVIGVSMKLKDVKENKILWQFSSFAGSQEYYTAGSQAKSEAQAITEAIDDLARRIVEQTIEVW
ncbi:MAG: LPS assembly lipoprotein LptE [Candidatus Omnitrophota bacterium]